MDIRIRRGAEWLRLPQAIEALTNTRAIAIGPRILSAYTLSDNTKLWVITEADRTVTTILKPEDY